MSRRTTLTVDDIARAAAGLQADGKNVTVAAVVARTGGSNTTVGRLLREWRGEAPATPPAARPVPPVAGQHDGSSLPAPVAAAMSALGWAVADAIGEARAKLDALADDADRLHEIVMDCGNTVSREEYEAVVAERDALRQQLADRSDNAASDNTVIGAAMDADLRDLADIFVRLVGVVGVRHPATLARWVAEFAADIVAGDCDHNRLDGGIAALERLWDFGASEVRHYIGRATSRNRNTVTNGAPRPPAITDDEIKATIADLTAKTGRVPSIKTIREALGGRPVSELRLRRAQAEAKKGAAAAGLRGGSLPTAPSFIHKRRAGQADQ